MKGKPNEDSNPSMGTTLAVIMMAMVITLLMSLGINGAMLMKMEDANQKKRRQQTSHHPPKCTIQRNLLIHRVGQEMEDANAQHQTTHAAHHHLQARVGQTHQRR